MRIDRDSSTEPDVVIVMTAEEVRRLNWFIGRHGTIGAGRTLQELRAWFQANGYRRDSSLYNVDGTPKTR